MHKVQKGVLLMGAITLALAGCARKTYCQSIDGMLKNTSKRMNSGDELVCLPTPGAVPRGSYGTLMTSPDDEDVRKDGITPPTNLLAECLGDDIFTRGDEFQVDRTTTYKVKVSASGVVSAAELGENFPKIEVEGGADTTATITTRISGARIDRVLGLSGKLLNSPHPMAARQCAVSLCTDGTYYTQALLVGKVEYTIKSENNLKISAAFPVDATTNITIDPSTNHTDSLSLKTTNEAVLGWRPLLTLKDGPLKQLCNREPAGCGLVGSPPCSGPAGDYCLASSGSVIMNGRCQASEPVPEEGKPCTGVKDSLDAHVRKDTCEGPCGESQQCDFYESFEIVPACITTIGSAPTGYSDQDCSHEPRPHRTSWVNYIDINGETNRVRVKGSREEVLEELPIATRNRLQTTR